MKRVFFVVFLLLLAACATTTTQKVEGIPSAEQAVSGGGASKATQANLNALIEQVKTEAESKNDKATELVLPINIRKGKAGDAFVFGFMFNPMNRQAGVYAAKADFIEGRDSSYNKIEMNKDAANAWITQPDTFTLTAEESRFVPIVIKPTGTPAPGNYVFEVQFYKVDGAFYNKIDKLVKNVNVKIE